jgi:DNA polymerase-3 subunit beta
MRLHAGSELTLSTFDYEVSAQATVPVITDEEGTVLVSGRLLAEIVRSLPARPVELATDGTRATLKCGSATFTLVLLPEEEYPTLPEMPPLAGSVGSDALATAIGQVATAAGRDDTLPALTGIRIEIDGDTLTLVATDRYRLAIRELGWHPAGPPGPVGRSTLLVPAKTLADAARMMASGVPVRILTRGTGQDGPRAGDAMIGFESGGRRLTTRLIGGDYIKYSSKFPADFGSCGDMPAVSLAEAVRRVALVAERGSSVRLSFEPGKVVIEAGTKGQARARETVAADFTGEESAIAFSPQYLLDGLSAALSAASGVPPAASPDQAAPAPAEGRIRLQFTSPTKPALITGTSGSAADGKDEPDYRYLVVPLRALASA